MQYVPIRDEGKDKRKADTAVPRNHLNAMGNHMPYGITVLPVTLQ